MRLFNFFVSLFVKPLVNTGFNSRLINTKLVKLIVCALISSACTNVYAVTSENLVAALRKIEAHIQNNVKNKVIPGCAIAVVHNNKVIFMNGYGVRTVGRPEKIDSDTVFQLGSVSKPIAATLASVLEQKGLINLDDPVRNYLPNFTLKGLSNPNNVRIKNLLSHTTGVPRHGFNNLIETFEPYPKIIRALQTTPMIAPVGKRYDYHNAMYSLIGEIAETATQKTFPEALSSNLLKPLKMTRTSATLEDLIRTQNRATPHTRMKKGGLRPATPYSSGYYSVAPAGGINSSARDMATFLKAQMGAFPEIISHRALRRIQTPQIPTHNVLNAESGAKSKNPSYGLGWRILEFADQKLVYHGGWVKGFTNFVAFLPEEQLGIVVLHNGDTRFSSRTAVKFFETALGMVSVKQNTKDDKKIYTRSTKKSKANRVNKTNNKVNKASTKKIKKTASNKKAVKV